MSSSTVFCASSTKLVQIWSESAEFGPTFSHWADLDKIWANSDGAQLSQIFLGFARILTMLDGFHRFRPISPQHRPTWACLLRHHRLHSSITLVAKPQPTPAVHPAETISTSLFDLGAPLFLAATLGLPSWRHGRSLCFEYMSGVDSGSWHAKRCSIGCLYLLRLTARKARRHARMAREARGGKIIAPRVSAVCFRCVTVVLLSLRGLSCCKGSQTVCIVEVALA